MYYLIIAMLHFNMQLNPYIHQLFLEGEKK
ncbi:MAG: hypothetical protein PWR19_1482 [Carnobacterium sp.]|nr:hypothetical protein [Carnobacterium sp.]